MVHIDFEMAVKNAVFEVFPSARIQFCRFHLGQSWYRKIQELGLTRQYRTNTSVGKWLRATFGMQFLPAAEVGYCFAEEIMSNMPDDENCQKYADYLTECYVDEYSTFPPHFWAEKPSPDRRTNNGPEAYHRNLNASLNSPHPNIATFVDFILELQATTYIKIRCLDRENIVPRKEREHVDQAMKMYEDLRRGDIERSHYIEAIAYKFQPV